MSSQNDNAPAQRRSFWTSLLDWLPVMDLTFQDIDPENLLGIREMMLRDQLQEAFEQANQQRPPAARHMPRGRSPATPPLPETRPPPIQTAEDFFVTREEFGILRAEFEILREQVREDRAALAVLVPGMTKAIMGLEEIVAEWMTLRKGGDDGGAQESGGSGHVGEETPVEIVRGSSALEDDDEGLRRRRSR